MEISDVEIEKIAHAAAKEIDAAFDIFYPRGRQYHNGILDTMRIIIAEQITHRGEARKRDQTR